MSEHTSQLDSPGARDRRVNLPVRLAPPGGDSAAGWRTGLVVNGRELDPQQLVYHPRDGVPGNSYDADPWDGAYFHEVDPHTLQPVSGGATHDGDGNYATVDNICPWACLRADGANSCFHGLKVGSLFRFRQNEDVETLTDSVTPYEIMADHHAWLVVPVQVTVDGGSAGSSTTTCTLTYTVVDLYGTVIGRKITPQTHRYEYVEYNSPTPQSHAIGYWVLPAGSEDQFELVAAMEEVPKGDWVTLITDFQVNTGTFKFQKKTRECFVLEQKDESEWTDVHTGNECD